MLTFYKFLALGAAVVLFAALIGIAYYASLEPKTGEPSLWRLLFPDALAVFTAVLAVATIGLWIVSAIQLTALNRAEAISARAADAAKQSAEAAAASVSVAKDSAERELRAYLYLEISSRPYPPAKPNRHAVSMTVTNGGKTWARNVIIKRFVVKSPPALEGSDPFEHADWDKEEAHPMVLGPGQVLSMQFGDIGTNEIPLIAMGDLKVFYIAWVTYEDTLSVPPVKRQTQISLRFNADTEGGVSFTYLPTHNCADGDCP